MAQADTEQLANSNTATHYKLKESDLPALCPMPGTSLWNSHPRVYLPVKENGGQACCPYCGAVYTLKT